MRKETAKTENIATYRTGYKLIQNSRSNIKGQFHHHFKCILDTVCVGISNSNTNHI